MRAREGNKKPHFTQVKYIIITSKKHSSVKENQGQERRVN